MDKKNKKNSKKKKRLIILSKKQIFLASMIISLLIILGTSLYDSIKIEKQELSYLSFKEMLSNNEIESVVMYDTSNKLDVITKDGNVYKILDPKYDEFKKDVMESGVNILSAESTPTDAIILLLAQLPILFLLICLIVIMLNTYGNIGKEIFKVFKPHEIITFNDIAGMSETKEEVKFVVDQIKNEQKLKEYGARPCRGLIFNGPPGTGKTMLAKAIAGEAGISFISCSGSDFIEMFVGLGAARVRSLWSVAEINSPCIIFIDEIDALGKRRGNAQHNENNQTLNALLQRMDGLETSSGIYVIAATNKLEELDSALLRPGRFDKVLYVGPPKTKKDRDEIIELYFKNKKLSEDVNIDTVSNIMYGFTGAEIENTINEAVLCSIQHNRDGIISMNDIDEASMKLRMQGVISSHTSLDDKYRASVHEAGHTIMNLLLNRDVSKVSVVPYSSGVGGITIQDTKRYDTNKIRSKSELYKDIQVLLGGYAAEKVILQEPSIGSSNDLEKASEIVFSILNIYGMDDTKMLNQIHLRRIGLLDTTDKIDIDASNNLLKDRLDRTIESLKNNKDLILKLADMLMNKEVVLNPTLDMINKQELKNV